MTGRAHGRGVLALALACAVATWLVGCDPIDRCDRDQAFSNGGCSACPEGASSDGETCRCDDPDEEIIGGRCRDPDAPDDDADGSDADAGSGGAPQASCDDYCGFLKSCLADNGLVVSVAADVIAMVGIDGDDATGCVSACTPDEAGDAEALACFGAGARGASCVGDQTLDGAGEALGIVDACCDAHPDAGICQRLCGAIATNAVALSMVPACQ